MTLLVIGCGNPDRGDDVAGLLVAERLREAGYPACKHQGDGLSLLDAWQESQHVLLVDAVVTGRPLGAITLWDAHTAPVEREVFGCSTHNFGVAEAIRLGRALDRLPSKLEICGIEAAHFAPGAAPSPEVLAAVERVAAQIIKETARCTSLR